MRTRAVSYCIFTLSACLALSACGGSSSSLPGSASTRNNGPSRRPSSTPIKHIVVLIQENRTFNNLFAQFPGATGTTTGLERIKKGRKWKQKKIALAQVPLEDKKNLNHLYVSYLTAYDKGKMDGFNRIIFQSTGKPENALPYQYVRQSDVQPYWDMATQYGLANAMFSTQGSGSFTAHQDLIRGGTEIGGDVSMIDDPTSNSAWGCDSPAGAKTSLITTSLKYEKAAGPFPCTDKFPYSSYNYTTLADLFDAAGITWKYYVPKFKTGTSSALMERVRRNRDRAQRQRVGNQRQLARDQHFYRPHQRKAAADVLGDSRLLQLRPPRLLFRHRPVVGDQRRQCRWPELVLELNGDYRRLG